MYELLKEGFVCSSVTLHMADFQEKVEPHF